MTVLVAASRGRAETAARKRRKYRCLCITSLSLLDAPGRARVAGDNPCALNEIRTSLAKRSAALPGGVYHGARRVSLLAGNTSSLQDSWKEQEPWAAAVRAAGSKKAHNVRVLDLREVASFADRFLVCDGSNSRQIQAISDAIGEELAGLGERPVSVEGYQNAEWILMDYGDFLVHIFSEKAREYYALERLWRHAKDVPLPALIAP